MRPVDEGPNTGMAEAVACLGDLVARLAQLTLDGALAAVPLAGLPDLVASIHRIADRLDSVAVTATARVDAAGVLPASTTSWLQSEAGLSSGAASSTRALGLALEGDYRATATAWLSGSITRGHASAITTLVDKVCDGIHHDDRLWFRPKAERAMLAFAEDGGTPARLATKARRLRAYVDPAGNARDVEEKQRQQSIRFGRDGEGFTVTGFLTAESHALISTALEQIVNGWHRDGTLPEAERVEGDDAASARRRRLRAPHLQALALVHLCGTFLETGALGTHHGVVPRVRLDVDLHDLHSAYGGLVHSPGRSDSSVLGHESVRRMLCDAEITTALVSGLRPRCTCGCACGHDNDEPTLDDLIRDSAKEVLYVGRAHRTITPRQRRALEIRDGGCTGPSCQVDASRCRGHHVIHWENGGGTDLDNTLLVCERHHHDVHERGWTIGADPTKRPTERDYFTWVPPARPVA